MLNIEQKYASKDQKFMCCKCTEKELAEKHSEENVLGTEREDLLNLLYFLLCTIWIFWKENI